jgi:UDP-N-acetylmuramate--alanine ligase
MYQLDFDKPIHVYFSGIGGISMSGLAQILRSRGFEVSGSDRAASSITDELAADGIKVIIGQKKENITPDIDLVVFTAAIRPDNPEYIAVMENKIPHITRSVLLGQIMRGYKDPVAISGTHGKTTTTSMISEIMMAAGTDPTLSIGGILDSIGGNVRIGNSQYFAAEACEYTNSFLDMFPGIGIILDIDADHLDFFKDLDDIRRSFRKFARLIPADGALIINTQIPDYEEISGGLECKVVLYGPDDSADYWPEDITYDQFARASYTLCSRSVDGTVNRQAVTLGVPGEHNVYNSLAAAAAADCLGIDRKYTAAALAGYTGTERRFQILGSRNGFTVIDDYAHHPTEIEATLRTALNYPHRELWCVFQSHTYTRTKALMDELSKIVRAIGKACPGAPHEVWLTVDASLGSNALSQAREFSKSANLTGLVLTKLDGSGKGGMTVAIHREFELPTFFTGFGEAPEDLQEFDPAMYAQALFADSND